MWGTFGERKRGYKVVVGGLLAKASNPLFSRVTFAPRTVTQLHMQVWGRVGGGLIEGMARSVERDMNNAGRVSKFIYRV